MKDIAIYGAGGLGREVLCAINSINQKTGIYNFIGFLDDGLPVGTKVEEYEVLGGMDYLNNFNNPLSVVIAIGHSTLIEKIIGQITNEQVDFPNIIAPDVLFMDCSKVMIGRGNVITFRSLVSLNVLIGNFNIMNVDVYLGHDSSIGDFNVMNSSVRISGNANIGNSNFFGVSSVVLQGKKIGNQTTIGANSVIIKNTKDNNLYLGNPAVLIKL